MTAVMPSPVKIAIKNKEASSAVNDVINREVMGGGKGILSVPTGGDNEVEGEETERPRKRAFVGDLLETASPCGELRQEQGQRNNEDEGEQVEQTSERTADKNQSRM